MRLTTSDDSRSLTIRQAPRGWEVSEEAHGQLLRRVSYADWHRVERACELFRLSADAILEEAMQE